MEVPNSSSGEDSSESDSELQRAFERGELKPGLNVETEQPKQTINNVSGMKQKLEEISQTLDWIERLDVSCDPAPPPPGTDVVGEGDIHDDFKREMKFYRQAQACVLQAIPKLHKLDVPTRRPEDYFAQMAKSDDHMKKVREKLLEKQMSLERSEKARKLRELRKYGKKVQHEVLLSRQKEKREMLDAVKKFRKGQKDKLDFLDDKGKSPGKQPKQGPSHKKDGEVHQPNKKRQYKNQRFGFGGQKKRSKLNTKKSAGDIGDFNPRINQNRKHFNPKGKGKGKLKERPGKSKRQKQKNRKR